MKKILILLIVLHISAFNNQFLLFAQDKNKDDFETTVTQMDENKNFEDGIELLFSKQYYASVDCFEKYMIESQYLLDSILGLEFLTFGQIRSHHNNAIKFFEDNVNNKRKNYTLYAIGIIKILALNEDASNFIKQYVASNPDSYEAHYILGVAYLFENKQELLHKECEYLKNTRHEDLCNKLNKEKLNPNYKKYIVDMIEFRKSDKYIADMIEFKKSDKYKPDIVK